MVERPNVGQSAPPRTALGDVVGDAPRATADPESPGEQVTSGVLDDSPTPAEDRPGVDGSVRARASSTAHKRALRRRGTVEVAVGVLIAHGGVPPHDALALLRSHAVRRGDALLDLADDVVAGRVDPSTILGPSRRGGGAR